MRNIIDRVQLEVGCSENKSPPTVLELSPRPSASGPGQASATTDSMMGNMRDPQMTTSRGETIWN